jgi:hypothetical protein
MQVTVIRWACHVVQIPDDCLPKKPVYGELPMGKRSQSEHKKDKRAH